MWIVDEFKCVPVELDFSSSGQDLRSATAIESRGVRLFNAIEWVEVDSAAAQVDVCECCGLPQCSPGGWVAFRRMGDRVAWIPAWDLMGSGTSEMLHYSPPSFMQARGAPVFPATVWQRLRALHASLPQLGDLPPITSCEIARLYQWGAPAHILGLPPAQPRLRRDLLVAVTDGDLEGEASAVDECLRAHFESDRPMCLISLSMAVRPIEFWTDLPDTPSWTRFAHIDKDVCFLANTTTAIVAESAVNSIRR